MSSGILEPVPSEPGQHSEEADDEYCLNRNNRCHLKLDFPDSTYTLSWPTTYSSVLFLSELLENQFISSERGSISVLSDEQDYQGVPLNNFYDEEVQLPGGCGLVKYSGTVDGVETEIEWSDYPSEPRIAINSGSVEPATNLHPFFKQSVSAGRLEEELLESAYQEAINQIYERLE